MEEMNCRNCYNTQKGKICYYNECKEKYGTYWRPRKGFEDIKPNEAKIND